MPKPSSSPWYPLNREEFYLFAKTLSEKQNSTYMAKSVSGILHEMGKLDKADQVAVLYGDLGDAYEAYRTGITDEASYLYGAKLSHEQLKEQVDTTISALKGVVGPQTAALLTRNVFKQVDDTIKEVRQGLSL